MKHRCCVWDSNPGPQNGKRSGIHLATAATQVKISGNGLPKMVLVPEQCQRHLNLDPNSTISVLNDAIS